MNLKQRMIELAEDHGRQSLYPYTIGNIGAVVECPSYTDEQKVQEVKKALSALRQTWNDESLPWDRTDAKKAFFAEGAAKEISHLECSIDVSRIKSLLEVFAR